MQIGQKCDELVATDPGHRVRFPKVAAQAVGDRLQQEVADFMPVVVVDRLEFVEIDEEQRDPCLFAPRARDLLRDAVLQQASIGQLRQRIVEGQLADGLFGAFALGDIARHAKDGDDVSIAVRVQRGDHLGLNDVPVLVRLIDLGDARKIGSVAGLPTGDRIGKHVLRALRRFRRQRRFKRLRDDFLGGIAAQRFDRWTHVAEAAARDVENPDHVGRVFGHETEALLALHKFRNRRFARAHLGSHSSVQARQRTGDCDGRDADSQHDADDEKPLLPLLFDGGFRVAGIEKTIERKIGRKQFQFGVGLKDLLPARAVHVADVNQIAPDQRAHFFCLIEQKLSAVPGRVFGENEVGDFLRMRHRIGPALEAGFAEGFCALRVRPQFGFGGKQIVAVEVDADGAWRKNELRNRRLVEIERLGRAVAAHGVDHAVN